ncbi:pyrimidine 5'-nucleotidase [Devosia sp. Leaf64]|jgi:putative hydrolase of the HAD superfamily|uniref:pyrimidine 5'-nucleotidase n=1 Tax=Devosia sp. Leaf64 TaxID=1736229 RepID=UPI0007156758|nr:pyrimidine 5'-nucleotidase [Devosia sp. Leaf64]KQN74973.1 HAD family hydrolase [Devosia sp. Leaf64]
MNSPAAPNLNHITDWVFDLDNTLYPRECNLFAQIDVLITRYVMDVTRLDFEEARSLQKSYYRDFGTTLNGLMHGHKIDPEHFLNTVHAIDYSPVTAHPALIDAIRALPGRKFILTNGDTNHARSVLGRLGGPDLFEDVHDIRAMTFVPKPHKQAYDGFLGRYGIDPTKAIMFDDLEKNLVVPHEIGMATVQVVPGAEFAHDQVEAWELGQTTGPHVHHVTGDLAGFLRNLR